MKRLKKEQKEQAESMWLIWSLAWFLGEKKEEEEVLLALEEGNQGFELQTE